MNSSAGSIRATLLLGGPLLGIVTTAMVPLELAPNAQIVLVLTIWMAIWWLSEAVPMAATALLPLLVLPLFGVQELGAVAEPYAHPLIFLFLGGLMLGLALQKSGLHERFATLTLRLVGHQPARIVGGFMLVSAILSMWMSNTAATLVMTPIATSLLSTRQGDRADAQFAYSLLLGIAFSASLGGMTTTIGTPPNLFLAAYLDQEQGIEIPFARWLTYTVPVVLVLLPATWWMLTRLLFRLDRSAIDVPGTSLPRERASGAAQVSVLVVFLLTAVGWVTRPLLTQLSIGDVQPLARLSDTAIAIAATVLLFALPDKRASRRRILEWPDTRELPWDVLLLFGGGLSLAGALKASGLAAAIGSAVAAQADLPQWAFIGAVTGTVMLLTEMTSNLATTTALVPILAEVADDLSMPVLSLVVPATMAASCAFVLPVATPPNAIVYATGRVPLRELVRAGLVVNVFAWIVIVGRLVWLP